ncbi:MAG: methylated-DNA--[protein]-cysteine S-methyltransferase [Acidimicrobiia bacterium]|nr:methylated-DNA--[protein]-cysteine S-methyltransferase [Acidimicrobiia bacterium]
MNIEDTLGSLRTEMPGVTTEAIRLGTGLVDGFDVFESPIGDVVVGFNVRGVSFVDLAAGFDPDETGRGAVQATPPKGWDAKIRRAIERGRPADLPVDLGGVTSFQRSVLEVAATIPYGQVRPYGWLADHVGNRGAVRAVGSTMARNPVPLIIPCHRVVRSDGRIGNYSLGGAHNKTDLLGHEGVDLDRLASLAARNIRFVGSDTTGIFCLPTCSHARRISDAHQVELKSAAAAEAAGFRPCKVCEPA